MEAIKNIKLVEAARSEAGALIKADVHLRSYPTLARIAREHGEAIHAE